MSTPNGNLSEFMKFFMKRTSDDIRKNRKIKNHLYGDRYYPTLVNDQNYFQTVFKYVYQNPLRAGLCTTVLEYKFSTLKGFLGMEYMPVPVYDDFHFFENLSQNLNWLNQICDPDMLLAIRNRLHRQQLSPKRNKNGYNDDTLLL